MAVDKIPQYNRIIELTLETTPQTSITQTATGSNFATGTRKLKIPCPVRGRKPSIEINASYAGNSTLFAFNVKVKNLYLDLINAQYATIKLKVGYENNTIDMEGTILSIYQESPGPEGSTIIQCQDSGTFTTWLDAKLQVYFEAGTTLGDILEKIKDAIGANQVMMGTKARTLSLKTIFYHDGTAREALEKLEKVFMDDNLHAFLRNDMICAICYTSNDYVESFKLDYMSAPPQPNAGTSEGTAYTTVTAPWIPQLKIGDRLEIPQAKYMRYLTTVNAKGKATQFIQVTALSLHFGTTGGINSMTVQGFDVKG